MKTHSKWVQLKQPISGERTVPFPKVLSNTLGKCVRKNPNSTCALPLVARIFYSTI